MSTIRHPNRRRNAASAIVRALIAWHPHTTQGEVLLLRKACPQWPLIHTGPHRGPRRGGLAHAG